MIRAPDDYADPGKLRRPGGRHPSRKPSRGAAGQLLADMRVVSDRGVYPSGDAAGEHSGRCAAGTALRIGSATRARKSSSVSRAGEPHRRGRLIRPEGDGERRRPDRTPPRTRAATGPPHRPASAAPSPPARGACPACGPGAPASAAAHGWRGRHRFPRSRIRYAPLNPSYPVIVSRPWRRPADCAPPPPSVRNQMRLPERTVGLLYGSRGG